MSEESEHTPDIDYDSKDKEYEEKLKALILYINSTYKCVYDELQLIGDGHFGKVYTVRNSLNEHWYAIRNVNITDMSLFYIVIKTFFMKMS